MLSSTQTLTALAADLTESGAPTDLVNWLVKLKLLVGVPFHYLVPDNDFLPPESIRFFHLDPDWISALADGASSIGRHYSGPGTVPITAFSDVAQSRRLHADPDLALGNLRRQQLRLDVTAASPATATTARTGFLLRSAAVKAWKSIDVAGYAKGASPYDYSQNPSMPVENIVPLDILRLVRLSPSLMLGIFAGELFELVLHQPPEAIHFGFQHVSPTASGDHVCKNLRVPLTNWDDPQTSYDNDHYQNQQLAGVFANPAERVLDMTLLSKALAAGLAKQGRNCAPGYYQATPTDLNFKDHLVSSDFALEMVQGVGLVSFINE